MAKKARVAELAALAAAAEREKLARLEAAKKAAEEKAKAEAEALLKKDPAGFICVQLFILFLKSI